MTTTGPYCFLAVAVRILRVASTTNPGCTRAQPAHDPGCSMSQIAMTNRLFRQSAVLQLGEEGHDCLHQTHDAPKGQLPCAEHPPVATANGSWLPW